MVLNKTEKLLKDMKFDFIEDDTTLGYISTGLPAFDWIISGKTEGGGMPLGRIVELFGAPQTGKSLVAYHILAVVQKLGGWAILDDAEFAVADPKWFAGCGINPDELIMIRSETIEDHSENAMELVKAIRKDDKEAPIVIVLDSLARLSTRKEIEDGFNKADMSKAKMVHKHLRTWLKFIKENRILYVMINQVVDAIGERWGDKMETPGGWAPKFLSSVRVKCSKVGTIKSETDDKEVIGSELRLYGEKNRCGPPFRSCFLQVFFTNGLVKESGLFDLALKYKAIEGSAGWFVLPGVEGKFRRTDIEQDPEKMKKVKGLMNDKFAEKEEKVG